MVSNQCPIGRKIDGGRTNDGSGNHQREIYDEELINLVKSSEIELPEEIENALRSNDLAWKNYVNLAPGYRKQYAGWLIAARRPETRKRRITEAIRLLEQNQKLGIK